MQPHQKRVVEEKKELDQKLNMLNAFIDDNAFFDTLPFEEKKRLIKQSCVMESYSQILADRITHF